LELKAKRVSTLEKREARVEGGRMFEALRGLI